MNVYNHVHLFLKSLTVLTESNHSSSIVSVFLGYQYHEAVSIFRPDHCFIKRTKP